MYSSSYNDHANNRVECKCQKGFKGPYCDGEYGLRSISYVSSYICFLFAIVFFIYQNVVLGFHPSCPRLSFHLSSFELLSQKLILATNVTKCCLVLSCILLYYKYFWNLNFIPLSANPTKWSNTLKQFVGKLPTNCFSVFDHFMKLALKGLRQLDCTKTKSWRGTTSDWSSLVNLYLVKLQVTSH